MHYATLQRETLLEDASTMIFIMIWYKNCKIFYLLWHVLRLDKLVKLHDSECEDNTHNNSSTDRTFLHRSYQTFTNVLFIFLRFNVSKLFYFYLSIYCIYSHDCDVVLSTKAENYSVNIIIIVIIVKRNL